MKHMPKFDIFSLAIPIISECNLDPPQLAPGAAICFAPWAVQKLKHGFCTSLCDAVGAFIRCRKKNNVLGKLRYLGMSENGVYPQYPPIIAI